MLESAENEMVRLISREIISQEFQFIRSRYLNVTDRRRDGQLALTITSSARLRAVKKCCIFRCCFYFSLTDTAG